MTPDQLREVIEKATPGPWFWPHANTLAGDGNDPDGAWLLVAGMATDISEEDATLIERLRNLALLFLELWEAAEEVRVLFGWEKDRFAKALTALESA